MRRRPQVVRWNDGHWMNFSPILVPRAAAPSQLQRTFLPARYAVVKGAMSDFVSLHEKIACGMAFRKHVEEAIRLDPDDALSYHLLGRWCFEVRWENAAAALGHTRGPTCLCAAMQGLTPLSPCSLGCRPVVV